MALKFPQIGLEAVLVMDSFNKGVGEYIKQVQHMSNVTSGSRSTLTQDFLAMGDRVVDFAAVTTGAIVTTAAAVSTALFKMAVDAAPLKLVEDAFYAVTDAAANMAFEIAIDIDTMSMSMKTGKEAGTEMLDALRTGSAFMVDDVTLMRNYNLAVQLVSEGFGSQLPGAMQYLQKVSAATGFTMDYLLNSLILGVGRLSPRLIDNLGVMVSLAEATDKAAEMFGKEADSVTKAEQQAGMMALVLERLAENTKSMPDLLNTNAQKWGALKTSIKNTSNTIGFLLQPALANLLGPLTELSNTRLQGLIDKFSTKFIPIIEDVTAGIGEFIDSLNEGQDFVTAFKDAVDVMFDGDVADRIYVVVDAINNFILAAMEFYQQHSKEIQDAILAIGAVLATAGIASLVTKIVKIIIGPSGLNLIIGAIALLYTAWSNNWFGIQDVASGVLGWVNSTVLFTAGKLSEAFGFFGDAIKSVYERIIKTPEAMEVGSDNFNESIGQMIMAIGELFGLDYEQLQPFIYKVSEMSTAVWNFVEDVGPAVREVVGHLSKAWQSLSGLFSGDALDTKIFVTNISGAIRDVLALFGVAETDIEKVVGNVHNTLMWIVNTVTTISGAIKSVIEGITKLWEENGDVITTTASWSWTYISDKISENIEKISVLIKPALDAIAAWWEENGSLVVGVVGQFWETTVGMIGGGIDIIGGIIRVGLALIAGDWETVWTSIKDITLGAKDVLVSSVMFLATSIGAIFGVSREETISTVTETWNSVIGWITGAIDTIVSAVTTFFDSIEAFWAENGTEITNSVTATWGAIVQFFTNVFNEIYDFIIKPVLDAISSLWEEHGVFITERVTFFLTAISEGFKFVFGVIALTVSSALDSIKTWWENHGEAIKAIASAAWNVIVGTLSIAWETIKTLFGAAVIYIRELWDIFLSALKGDWSSVWESIKTIVVLVWDTIVKLISGSFEFIKLLWSGFTQTVSALWTDFWANLKRKVSEGFLFIYDTIYDALFAIIDGIISFALGVYNLFSDIIDSVVGFFTDTDWSSVGTGIIDGIKQGVSNAAQGMIDRAVQAARDALQAVKDFLGIQSPSKAAEHLIGEPFVAGIGVGIADGIKKLQANNWNLDLNNMVDTHAATSGRNSVTQSSVKYYNLTINTSTPAEMVAGDFRFLEALN